ncbi:MAG: class I SAM-dependent methyltransferase [Oscillospiraceae bacterium]|nr:class I SAM-dependent methyltransferase [Oscillospiraceae bacterium]
MEDPYRDFAYDYDLFGEAEQYIGREYTFFRRLFDMYGVKSVLDCACGTGRHLFAFHQMGLKTAGSDLSPSMLDVAEKYLLGKALDLSLKQCDFRWLERCFEARFDAVVCLSTSLPHLHSDEDLIQALSSMRARLNPGGILVLTQGTTDLEVSQGSPVEVVVNKPDFTRVFIKDMGAPIFSIKILDIFHSAHRVGHNLYDMRYRLLLCDEYSRLLDEAGFKKAVFLGDYEMGRYRPTQSERLIVVAEK